MPICERDPWRYQFFENVACPEGVNIPTDDIDCWEWFKDYRWVYNKLTIAKSQSIRCGLHENPPSQFPVFSKPNVNLKGMGINGKAIYSATEFAAHSVPGHMWMELFQGPHVSTDCAVVAGRAVWFRHAEGMRWHEGMFKHWVIYAKPLLELEDFLRHWVEKHMAGYTGMMNFETIGGHIIEAHLRFADQWIDLYGVGWVDALVNLYAEGKWTFKPGNEVEGYSIPLFAKPHARLLHPPAQVQAEIRSLPHVRSLQIAFHEMKDVSQHPMPPGGFRLGIINADVLQAGFFARRKLAEAFAGIEIMLPE